MKSKLKRALCRWVVTLGFGLAAVGAQAATITTTLYDSTTLVTGANMQVADLNLSAPGQLSVRLTDMKFPDLLSTLSFTLTTATGVFEPTHALSSASGEALRTWTFGIEAPTTLYAAIFAKPVTGAGMYNVQISYVTASPVPLPASAWLLLTGLGVVLVLRQTPKLSQTFAAMRAA